MSKVNSIAVDDLVNRNQLRSILHVWRHWSDPDAQQIRDWCSRATQTEHGIIQLLSALVNRSQTHTFGDAVARTRWRVDLSELERYVSFDGWEERLRNRMDLHLNEHQKHAMDAFFRELDRKREGRTPSSPFDDE